MITKKQLIELAGNREAMQLLQEIAEIQEGRFYRKPWVQKAAKSEMRKLAQKILDCLKEGEKYGE